MDQEQLPHRQQHLDRRDPAGCQRHQTGYPSYLDKLIDELAKGKAMENIPRR